MILDEPIELSGKNLRNRNAMNIVDLFDENKGVTVRLTCLYMDYSMTHLGFSIDPPFSDWNITDLTIVDDMGKTYWISISRSNNIDPFFPIRIITDSIPINVTKIMIAIKRIYFTDKKMEAGFEQSLSSEEEKIYDNIPSLGDDGSVSLEIKEINKKLRELERKRFFHLPIIKQQIEGRWSFVVAIDHSVRSRIHRIYQLKNKIKAGNIEISPTTFKTGILRNELVCNYKNSLLNNELIQLASQPVKEDEESIIFTNNNFSPIPPLICVSDKSSGKEYLPRGGKHSRFNRGAGNVLITDNSQFLLHYQFDAFDFNPDELELNIKGLELPYEGNIVHKLSPGEIKNIEFKLNKSSGEYYTLPVKVVASINNSLDKSHSTFIQIKYTYTEHPQIMNFWIPESILTAGEANRLPLSHYNTEKRGNEIITTLHFIANEQLNLIDFLWKIKSYYCEFVNPIREKCQISGVVEPEAYNRELVQGKIIMPEG